MLKKLINNKFKKDLSFSYLTQGLTVVFGFLQLFLITRYYGVDIFGQLTIIVSTAGIFSNLLSANSGEVVTRFFKREELNKNYINAKFVLFIGFAIDIATAFFLVLLIYFSSTFIATTFLKDISLEFEIIIYSFITFIFFLKGSLIGYLQSKEMFKAINGINIIESFSKILLLLIFIFIFNKLLLIDIILIFLISSIVSFLYALFIFLKSYLTEYISVPTKYNKTLFREYWHFNIKIFFSTSLKAGNNNIDNLILAYLSDSAVVGIYQIIKRILSPISLLIIPFTMLIYTKIIHFFETNQKEKFKNIIIKITTYLLLISISYIFISYFFLNNIFNLLDIEFKNNYNFYYFLVSIITILSVAQWWARIFSNTVNPNYSLYSNIFATLYQLSITIIISMNFGFIGMLLSIMTMNIILLLYWLKKGYNYVYK